MPLAVVLLAYGGPRDLEGVEPFLRRIMRPAEPTTEMVVRARERYAAIGGGSPLVANTHQQRDALRAYLRGGGAAALNGALGAEVHAEVFVGMRHTTPWVDDGLAQALAWGGGRTVAVIMASHQSDRATGGYRDDVRRALGERGGSADGSTSGSAGPGEVVFVPPWHTSPPYLDAVAERTRAALAELGATRSEGPAGDTAAPPIVIFTAHSLPMRDDRGDQDYEQGLFDTARGVMARVGDVPWRLAYQSRSGRPGTVWSGPGVEEVLAEEAARGVDKVAVVPLGFVVEHLETLYDLDVALQADARRLGVRMVRAGTVRDHPAFIVALGDAVVRAVRDARWGRYADEGGR